MLEVPWMNPFEFTDKLIGLWRSKCLRNAAPIVRKCAHVAALRIGQHAQIPCLSSGVFVHINHVYSTVTTYAFPTNPPCIRYVDGRHYCTKNFWFESNPDDFPAPFNKAFHFEMGVEATDGSTDDREGGSPFAAPPEMLVDYVRIAQVGWLESAQWHASRQAPFSLRVCGS